MCGLFFTNVRSDNFETIRQFIENRGSDETNTYISGRNKFLHSRLAINNFGLVGKQPIELLDGTVVVMFNGEIYNFKELAKNLYSRRDINDTELLGRLISDIGIINAIPKLNGMYSIVVHDINANRIFCARDQFGQKPLFYSSFKNEIRISSSVTALAKLKPSSPSEDAFKVYASYGYFPYPYTAYEDIFQFEPGTVTEINLDNGIILNKTAINYQPSATIHGTLSPKDSIKIFDQMASRHVCDDINSCLLLSGGVDSTLVSTFMVEHGVKRSFSIGFPDQKEFDETEDAIRVASALGLTHSVLDFTQKDYFQQVQKLNSIYEQPFGDSSALPTSLLVTEIARCGFKVAYGGDGGDELFFGYKRHQKFGDLYQIMPVIRSLAKYIDYLGIDIKNHKIQRLIGLCQAESPSEFILMTRNLSRSLLNYSELHHGAEIRDTFTETLKYFDIKSVFSNDLMVKTDRPSMYAGVEIRSPLLDFEINIISDLLLRSDKFFYRKNKQFLRDVIRIKNSNVFQKAQKKGFSVPVGIWMRNEWKEWATDLMNDFMKHRRFDYDYSTCQVIFKNHMNDKISSRDYIWSILMYQSWINAQ